MENKKTILNLFDINKYLSGRKWEELSEEEKNKICGDIAKKINEQINKQKMGS